MVYIPTYNGSSMENKFTKTENSNIIPRHKQMKNLAFGVLKNIEEKYEKSPKKVIDSWPEIIGSKYALLARAVSFERGVLTVEVTGSILYSLLVSYEKAKLLKKLQNKFSVEVIQNIIFKIG